LGAYWPNKHFALTEFVTNHFIFNIWINIFMIKVQTYFLSNNMISYE
jgi:hypothetical protein